MLASTLGVRRRGRREYSRMPEQQTLFDPEPAPWELDDAAQQHVATVVLASGPGGEFDYLVPEGLKPEVGCRVKVPLGGGNRGVVGYCVAIDFKPAGGRRLKSIAEVLDAQALLSP